MVSCQCNRWALDPVARLIAHVAGCLRTTRAGCTAPQPMVYLPAMVKRIKPAPCHTPDLPEFLANSVNRPVPALESPAGVDYTKLAGP